MGAAKSSWLEKQQDMVGAVKPTGMASTSATMDDEAAAKTAWLAKQEMPQWGTSSEAAAKAAWLAKSEELFTASWGKSTKTFAAAQTGSPGVMPIDEASAKAAWLAKSEELFKASWGRK